MTGTLRHPTTPSTARPERCPWDVALILGVPIAWAALLLVHPTGDGTIYDAVDQRHAAWQSVHLGMVAFIPLMAVAVHRLVRGVHGTAARISRAALPVYAVVYGAYEAVMGLGTGALVSAANDTVASADRVATVDAFAGNPVIAALEHAGSLACGVAFVAAAFALHHARRVSGPLVALFVLATPLIAMHAPPFGPVGLVLFVIVAGTALRRQAGRR